MGRGAGGGGGPVRRDKPPPIPHRRPLPPQLKITTILTHHLKVLKHHFTMASVMTQKVGVRVLEKIDMPVKHSSFCDASTGKFI